MHIGIAGCATAPNICQKKAHLQLKIVFIVVFLDVLNMFSFLLFKKKNEPDFRGMYFV